MVTKIGFIGFGNHAKRLHKSVETNLKEFELVNFHPNKAMDGVTNDFQSILDCQAVFITAPNHTHFHYIMRLLEESVSFIFCEKPPCVSRHELLELSNLNSSQKRRIFFNFNFRFSAISNTIKEYLGNGSVGAINYVSAVTAHGLAFKKGYKESWRGQYSRDKSVVLDTSLVHLIDLFNYCLKDILHLHSGSSSTFSYGIDTFGVNLLSEAGASISLHATYAAPCHFSIDIIGTNGLIEVRNDVLCVKSPRDTFDQNGFFTAPPIISDEPYSFESDYEYSLQRAVEHFFTVINSNNGFKEEDYDLSLETMEILFSCEGLVLAH